nr:AP-3 complex subunit delta-1-like [Loxodonta africana]
MPASDQCVKLEQERRLQWLEKDQKWEKQQQEKEHEGRYRCHSLMHAESDEDVATAPKNALPSDEDDRVPSDSSRALDTDLDK